MRFKRGDIVQIVNTIDAHRCDVVLMENDVRGRSIEKCPTKFSPVLGSWWDVEPTDVLLYRRPTSRKRKAGR